MKTNFFMILALLLIVCFGGIGKSTAKSAAENESIRIYAMPEIKSLAESWISMYAKTNSDVKFDFVEFGIEDFDPGSKEDNSLNFIIQRPDVSFTDQSIWRMSVGRDVIVAVTNSNNPFLEMLYEKGVTEKELLELFTGENQKKWGAILKTDQGEFIKSIILDEPVVQASISKFLGQDPLNLETSNKMASDEFIETLVNEKFAIGFCRLATIVNMENHKIIDGISLLPIDKNMNGNLDYNEKIYADLEQFERSVWIGKYPRALINTIYAVAAELPENENIKDFLNWIVVSGQPIVEESGFTNLAHNEMQLNLGKLNPPVFIAEASQENESRSTIILLGVLIFIAGVLLISLVVRKKNKITKLPLGNFSRHVKILNENILSFPSGLYFDKSHTWLFMEKEGLVKFGIDDFMPNVTGDYTRVVLKNPGDIVKRKEPIVTLIQKGKQITINAPVSGTIKEINESLVVDPYMINSSPYTDGWVYKIEPSNWIREIQFFTLGNEYKEWIKSEIVRLKDFLACSFNLKNLTENKLAFQEGGDLIPEPLKNLEPKIWEDFQSFFIESTDKY